MISDRVVGLGRSGPPPTYPHRPTLITPENRVSSYRLLAIKIWNLPYKSKTLPELRTNSQIRDGAKLVENNRTWFPTRGGHDVGPRNRPYMPARVNERKGAQSSGPIHLWHIVAGRKEQKSDWLFMSFFWAKTDAMPMTTPNESLGDKKKKSWVFFLPIALVRWLLSDPLFKSSWSLAL